MNKDSLAGRSIALPLLILFLNASADAQSDGLRQTGYVPETVEQLAASPVAPVYRDWYPDYFDLSEYSPRPGDQGAQGSCVGWAVAYGARTSHFAYDHQTSPNNTRNIASPAALYNQIKTAGCGDGANIYNALQFLKDRGVPSLEEFPYDEANCSAGLSAFRDQSLQRFRIKDFGRLTGTVDGEWVPSPESGRIQAKIFRGQPVVIGMRVPLSFHRYRGGVFNDVKDTKGGHAVTIVGYNDEQRVFKILNSWGRNWGENGYMRISYDALGALIHSAYVMDTDPPDLPPSYKPPPTVVVDDPEPIPSGAEGRAVTLARQFQCAGISAFDPDARSIHAFAQTPDDAAELKDQLSKELADFRADVLPLPWPQCEAMLTYSKPLKSAEGMDIEVAGVTAGTVAPVLRDGDPLVLKIRSPDFPSYIYVAYLQADNDGKHEAVHLVQSIDPLKQYPPGSELVFGDGIDGRSKFTIQGPNFGREMIIAIATASPLYSKMRPTVELERDYLSAFRDRLHVQVLDKGERRAAARIYALTTKPKD